MDTFYDVDQRLLSENDKVYFVPQRWWKGQESTIPHANGYKGILYTALSPSSYVNPMKLINNFFNTDLVLNLKREEDSGQIMEVGISGREYALISEEMWVQAQTRQSEFNAEMKNGCNSFSSEEAIMDVFTLQLRLSVVRESNQLSIKINKKDNTVDIYKKACKIFSVESEPLRIWDFSGQINLFFYDGKNKFNKDGQRPSDSEILLALQVYGLSDPPKCKTNGKKDETLLQPPKVLGWSLPSNGSLENDVSNISNNDNVGCSESEFFLNNYAISTTSSALSSLGLRGLQNLGNTCFMNSAIQCLAHTPQLVNYFLGNYSREVNQHNPLGMNGEVALAFGELLRKLWSSEGTPIPPRLFKLKLAHFAPQFSGFNQHDSQELLAFLLDGLHEDLNRVKSKPYIEVKDADGRPDEEVAYEYWKNHVARNDSIIVDTCQGQYKSTLVCPVCNKVSVTFDPFMYLSLPLPSTTMRTMTVTVFSTDGSSQPFPHTISVPKNGKCQDLVQALSIACSLRSDETLLVAEIYNSCIIRYLEDPFDSLSLIRDEDRLAAYKLPRNSEKSPLIVFMHQHKDEYVSNGKTISCSKAFGVPLVTRINSNAHGNSIHNLYLKLLTPFQCSKESDLDDEDSVMTNANDEVSEMDADTESLSTDINAIASVSTDSYFQSELEFYLTDEKGQIKSDKIDKIDIYDPQTVGARVRIYVLACHPDKTLEQYDIHYLNTLSEIFKPKFLSKRLQETISLYACLEAFLKEEPLGPEDMWYCPQCKTHQQASKKLDLWRLPEVLVIHLKRFSYSKFFKTKLETFVDFPIHDLDLSSYVSYKNGQVSDRYALYAISNHYGSMGGGHYTAYVYHQGQEGWYDFDDSYVTAINEENIKTTAAYVLFYRRI